MIKTRITDLLGVDYPIQCGTMMHISNADFVAACANAGIFTCLASAMFQDEQALIDELNRIKALTDKPFGVNVSLFPGHDQRSVDVTLDILARENIKIIETAGRSPEPHLDKIRQNGAVHLHKCARLRDAIKVDKMGVDIIAVVGTECCGHPGMEDIGTVVLVPEVAEQIKAPLFAGGGFCDGKGLVSALALGAEGVLMGSRFLCTKESRIHENIKQSMLKAGLTDTVTIQRSIGSPVRVLDNPWAQEILEMESNGATFEELLPKISGQLTGEAWISGGEEAIFACGQVVGRTHEILSVGELVAQIVSDAEKVFSRLSMITKTNMPN